MRVAIVGLGRMGRVHIEALRAIGAKEIIGFDSDTEVIETFLGNDEILAYPMEAMRSILGQASLDGAVMSMTTLGRFEISSLIMREFRPGWLLIEKPVASSLRQLDELRQLAHRSGTRLAVNHQMMFLPQYTVVKELVDAHKFGSLRSMTVSGANFGLANNVSHYFEAFRFLGHSEITHVAAYLESDPIGSHRGRSFNDYAGSLRAHNSSGCVLYADFGSSIGHGIIVTYSFEYAKVVVDELLGRVCISSRRPEHFSEPTSRYGLPSLERDFHFQPMGLDIASARVIAAVAGAMGPYPDEEVASHSLRCLVGAVASSENNSRLQPVQQTDLLSYHSREFSWS